MKTDDSTGYSCLSKNTASIVAKVLANNKDVANAHVNGQTVEEEKLPCEFCEAMIPMYKLHSHQVFITQSILTKTQDLMSQNLNFPKSSLCQ